MKDIFDPRSYGAVADGRAKDTAAVQGAIDAAAAQGGTVRLAGGTFVCGTLYLKSNVALEITNSATLLASPDIADYGTDTHHNRYATSRSWTAAFCLPKMPKMSQFAAAASLTAMPRRSPTRAASTAPCCCGCCAAAMSAYRTCGC